MGHREAVPARRSGVDRGHEHVQVRAGIVHFPVVAASLQLPQEKAEALDEIIERTMAELDMADAVSTDFRSNKTS